MRCNIYIAELLREKWTTFWLFVFACVVFCLLSFFPKNSRKDMF